MEIKNPKLLCFCCEKVKIPDKFRQTKKKKYDRIDKIL